MASREGLPVRDIFGPVDLVSVSKPVYGRIRRRPVLGGLNQYEPAA
jgi:hypothetical protein